MKNYKVLFTGLGSIGQKHLKNLLSLDGYTFQADALRRENKKIDGINTVYTSFDKIPNDYDIIFITNPTHLHYETISELSSKTKNMFIEKPIFDKPAECKFAPRVNYVACPLRHNSVVKDLKEYVSNHDVYAFRTICSSYLPDWRKNSDYRNCYSAKADMGGGVELDLIHEIDYLKWIFGKFDTIKRISSKKSDLEISSNDVALYLLENSKVAGSLHLDYFGRETKRQTEVFAKDETKVFDLLKNTNDMYLEELKYFMTLVENDTENGYNTPEEAIESLEAAIL